MNGRCGDVLNLAGRDQFTQFILMNGSKMDARLGDRVGLPQTPGRGDLKSR